ncbi:MULTISPECIES: hypothetical protein [unclassified Leucobacter]|uniref:hypothetical protein n=1 Tax=unclassified Leucobacter TaxID=2621730 RepID=UPI001BFD7133|nr:MULTISPECIES: hypothetical protein [unclassified Leucobacter]
MDIFMGIGLAGASLMFAFLLSFSLCTRETDEQSFPGLLLLVMGVMIIGTSLSLIDEPWISPLWLQYMLLVVAPLTTGFILNVVLLASLSKSSPEDAE